MLWGFHQGPQNSALPLLPRHATFPPMQPVLHCPYQHSSLLPLVLIEFIFHIFILPFLQGARCDVHSYSPPFVHMTILCGRWCWEIRWCWGHQRKFMVEWMLKLDLPGQCLTSKLLHQPLNGNTRRILRAALLNRPPPASHPPQQKERQWRRGYPFPRYFPSKRAFEKRIRVMILLKEEICSHTLFKMVAQLVRQQAGKVTHFD